MLALGAVLGAVLARRVEMTAMPQLVAALHSFVGLAAVFIGLNSDLTPHLFMSAAERNIHEVEIFLGVFIGAVTFTGSIIAYGKLSGRIGGKALVLPGRHVFNITLVVTTLVLMSLYLDHARQLDAVRDDADCVRARRAPGHGHRRRRHAGGGLHAQLLFGLGGRGDRLPAGQ